jgi:hypothetical protein
VSRCPDKYTWRTNDALVQCLESIKRVDCPLWLTHNAVLPHQMAPQQRSPRARGLSATSPSKRTPITSSPASFKRISRGTSSPSPATPGAFFLDIVGSSADKENADPQSGTGVRSPPSTIKKVPKQRRWSVVTKEAKSESIKATFYLNAGVRARVAINP